MKLSQERQKRDGRFLLLLIVYSNVLLYFLCVFCVFFFSKENEHFFTSDLCGQNEVCSLRRRKKIVSTSWEIGNVHCRTTHISSKQQQQQQQFHQAIWVLTVKITRGKKNVKKNIYSYALKHSFV